MNTENPPDPITNTSVHTDWPKTLEWIEKQAQDSLKARFATTEILTKESQTTMTVLLAGVGGSATYAAKIFGPAGPDPIAIGFAWVCIYLVILCVLHSFFVCR